MTKSLVFAVKTLELIQSFKEWVEEEEWERDLYTLCFYSDLSFEIYDSTGSLVKAIHSWGYVRKTKGYQIAEMERVIEWFKKEDIKKT